ncbi:MAG: hypothetical protein KUG79_02700 [Pseudomonadales bacterium]|nr:hypothetical protein [Pseudomonadales bacterium]
MNYRLRMTYPGSHLISPDGIGTYHVYSRCVRRSFLCGRDPFTVKDFSHRREWIEARIFELSEIFSISICAYAILNNHYHIVLNVEIEDWSDVEVAERWLKLCPGRDAKNKKLYQFELLRSRLRSLSWFMRFINEPLARFANKEDDCTGRFWEGRFRSQILLDEPAVLACMAYVDLNPVRANIAESLQDSDYTSIQHRLYHQADTDQLSAINSSTQNAPLGVINVVDYIELVTWIASRHFEMKSNVNLSLPVWLENKHINPDHWFQDHISVIPLWQRAIGSLKTLKDYAAKIGQRWIKKRNHPSRKHI